MKLDTEVWGCLTTSFFFPLILLYVPEHKQLILMSGIYRFRGVYSKQSSLLVAKKDLCAHHTEHLQWPTTAGSGKARQMDTSVGYKVNHMCISLSQVPRTLLRFKNPIKRIWLHSTAQDSRNYGRDKPHSRPECTKYCHLIYNSSQKHRIQMSSDICTVDLGMV